MSNVDEVDASLISVIMPCFNAEARIKTSVLSVLSQSYDNFELIIIDDGSTDNSLGIINSIDDSRIRVETQKNSGVCVARNKGLKLAKGIYIAFLDADDEWGENCLNELCAGLRNKDSAVLAYCGWQNIGLSNEKSKPFIPPEYEVPNKMEIMLGGCRWPIHATLTRKKAIEQAGCFDLKFETSEDYLLWLKIVMQGRIVRVPKVLAFYHHHDGPQVTKNRYKAAVNNWLVKKEFLKTNSEVIDVVGKNKIDRLVNGSLLARGYECYWNRNLKDARKIFRLVMSIRYGTIGDWKYMLPSILPYRLHEYLLQITDRKMDGKID